MNFLRSLRSFLEDSALKVLCMYFRLLQFLMRMLRKVTFNLLQLYRHGRWRTVGRKVMMHNNASASRKLSDQRKQLFVDVSELVIQDAGTGIQRLVRSILQEWITNPPENFNVQPVYASRGLYKYARQFSSKFFSVSVDFTEDAYIEYQAGDVFIGLDFNYDVIFSCRDFYQEMRRNGVQVQFVVYDLLCLNMPEHFFYLSAEKHQRWLEIVAESDGAVCISKAVADELSLWFKKYFPKRAQSFQISWFHLGADIQNSVSTRSMPVNAEDILKKLQQAPSFLMVGTLEPRKGYKQVLAAFEWLWHQNIWANIVIVGKQGWRTEALVRAFKQHEQLNQHLFWLENVSDEFLEKIYQACDCLLAASEGEGFGLPLIEAARHGLPIIARDIPVFHEVTREQAFFFRGKSPENLAEAVAKWLTLFNKGMHPGSEKIGWLTWRQSAQQLLSCILLKKASVQEKGAT